MGKGKSLDRIAKSKGYLTERDLKDHGVSKAVIDDKGEEIQGMRTGTNLFGKGQRIISDAYRVGFDQINWDKSSDSQKEKKHGFKVVTRGSKAALADSDKCSGCPAGSCEEC